MNHTKQYDLNSEPGPEKDDLGARAGEDTHDEGKYDHIFFTRNLRWHWGDATFSEHSDHAPLWGALTIP